MTKVRHPLTFERAITIIAGAIGWERAAEIAGVADRTIRRWSEPDGWGELPLKSALALDLEYRRAGGDGAPLLQCYATLLETESLSITADRARLQALIGRAAKEGGEALDAAIQACLPGADDRTIARAELELEESIRASTDTLATLRAGRRGEVQNGSGSEGKAGSVPGEGED